MQQSAKKNWRTIFFVTTILLVPAVLLLISVQIVATNTIIYTALHSLVNPEDSVSSAYSEKVIAFLQGNIDISEDPNFTLAEYNHLEDVKSLLSKLSLFMYVLLSFFIINVALSNKRVLGLLYGANLSLLLILIIVSLAFIYGFEEFFDNMHKPFFNTGSWQFPQESRLIKTYPTEFFMYFGIVYSGVFVLLSLLLLLVATILKKKRVAKISA